MSMLGQYLKKQKITHSAFARSVGCSQVHVSLIISGERTPSIKLARKMAKATGGALSTADFLGLTAEDAPMEQAQ